jgi:hypothetical protein
MVAIQYNSIGLINTQYYCDCTRAHADHVMLQPAGASPSVVFKQLKCKDVFSTSATSVHCRTIPGILFNFQNELCDTFPDSPMPNKSTCFCDTGSVQDRNCSGRPSVLSNGSLDDIHHTLVHSPRTSLRKLYLQSGLSYGSVHKATKILKLHPYRVHVMHELKKPDKEKQLQYC